MNLQTVVFMIVPIDHTARSDAQEFIPRTSSNESPQVSLPVQHCGGPVIRHTHQPSRLACGHRPR